MAAKMARTPSKNFKAYGQQGRIEIMKLNTIGPSTDSWLQIAFRK
jgi:hypothetical protein